MIAAGVCILAACACLWAAWRGYGADADARDGDAERDAERRAMIGDASWWT